jgi:anti-sigma regulatory factor (Ser/Thr protein kinase)
MSDARTIELRVPGLLQFRDVALRVVMEACKLVGKRQAAALAGKGDESPGTEMPLPSSYDFHDQFTLEFTSAFSEIYNNIPIHAYEGKGGGTIEFIIHIGADHLMVDIVDTGKCFDIDTIPLPDELPMSGMGIHIARTMLDDLEYVAGPPNRWRLVKYMERPQESPEQPPAPPGASAPE